MHEDLPSWTAEVVCFMRATDQHRRGEERVLDDPFARLFLRPPARAALRVYHRLGRWPSHLSLGMTNYVLFRHRFIDDCLAQALQRPGLAQLVLLGAGYDTRAHRFAAALGGRPVFELDFPATAARKARIVATHRDVLPAATVHRVPIDFRRDRLDERLLAAGFLPQAPTFFIWEGVAMYLTRDAVKETLRTVRALAAPGSELALDCWTTPESSHPRDVVTRVAASLMDLIAEPLTFTLHPEDAEAFFSKLGFSVVTLADAAALRARYGAGDEPLYPAPYLVHCRTTASADSG